MSRILIAASLLSLLTGCENVIARQYGGHLDINLPACHRLVNATWKESDLWYLTEPMGSAIPRNTTFREKSTFGQLEGSITFREKCNKSDE